MTPSSLAVETRVVTSEIRNKLDAVEKLAPKKGQLDLGAYVRGTGSAGSAGGMIDYQHRLNPSTAIFGSGSLGYGFGESRGLNYEAMGGFRVKF